MGPLTPQLIVIQDNKVLRGSNELGVTSVFRSKLTVRFDSVWAMQIVSWRMSEYKSEQAGGLPAGFAPIFPDICYHLTHYKPAAADIPVASDNPAHYADAIRYNARTPLQGSLLPLTRLVWA